MIMENKKEWMPFGVELLLWCAIIITPLKLILHFIINGVYEEMNTVNIIYTVITATIHIVGCVLIMLKNKYGLIIFVPIILNVILSLFLHQEYIIMHLFRFVFWVVILLIHHNGKPMYRHVLDGNKCQYPEQKTMD